MIIESNKKARRDYEIIDKFEAGMSLLGSEVKSIRNNGISLKESYIKIKRNECYLVRCHIAPYSFARKQDLDPYRERKLLIKKSQIIRLHAKIQQKGLTLVPLKVYFNAKGLCKVELGLGKGKKSHDKRQDIKKREVDKKLRRIMKK